jgi:hypothetical protein
MIEGPGVQALRTAAAQQRIRWHRHGLERLIECGIARAEVVEAIVSGEPIAIYPTDRPFPSCLILRLAAEPRHVVAAVDPDDPICHVITADRPHLMRCEPDWKTRKTKP